MKFTISRNDNTPIGMITTNLDSEGVFLFLEEVDAPYLYSVGEYDDEDNCIDRLNGEEWLNENTEMRRCLK